MAPDGSEGSQAEGDAYSDLHGNGRTTFSYASFHLGKKFTWSLWCTPFIVYE